MTRFLAVLAFLLLAAEMAHSTVAVLIPTRDGFVVASDSRVTYMGANCDGIPKIFVPALPARTVALVTGDSVFVRPPGAKDSDPCQWLASAPHLLDMNAVVTGFLKQFSSQSGGNNTEPIPVADLAAACVQATVLFQQSYPAALRAYAGKEIFSVVVATYDPGTATTTLSSFVVRMAAGSGSIESARTIQTKVDPSSSHGIWIYGESEWVNRVVYRGEGRRFLNAATLDFLQGDKPVSEVVLEQAEAIAADVIGAAIRAAAVNPPPSGIGGEIRRMAVSSNPVPQQLPAR